MMLCFAFFV